MTKWLLIGILKGAVAVNVPGVHGFPYPNARSYDVFDSSSACEAARREWMIENAWRAYRAVCLPVELARPGSSSQR